MRQPNPNRAIVRLARTGTPPQDMILTHGGNVYFTNQDGKFIRYRSLAMPTGHLKTYEDFKLWIEGVGRVYPTSWRWVSGWNDLKKVYDRAVKERLDATPIQGQYRSVRSY